VALGLHVIESKLKAGCSMPILDICSKSVACVEGDETLLRVAQLMKMQHVGDVVVVKSNGNKKPIGIVTDRDIALAIAAEGLSPATKVSEIMSTHLVTAKNDFGISDTIKKMEAEAVRRIVVLDHNGDVCGMVSLDDMLKIIAGELSGLGHLVERQPHSEWVQNTPTRRNLLA
jgi:predicted transcriptional regulator